MASPHDLLVKKALSLVENAEGELRVMLPPALVERIDWTSLSLEPGSFVSDESRELRSDLLFSATVRDGRSVDDKTRVLLYLLLEHQSTPDRWMALRLLVYMQQIWTREREEGARSLPLVFPLVLHHGASGWTSGTRFRDLFDADPDLLALAADFIPDFGFVVDDLVRVPERALLERHATAMTRLVLWALRVLQRRAIEPLPGIAATYPGIAAT